MTIARPFLVHFGQICTIQVINTSVETTEIISWTKIISMKGASRNKDDATLFLFLQNDQLPGSVCDSAHRPPSISTATRNTINTQEIAVRLRKVALALPQTTRRRGQNTRDRDDGKR